MLMSPQAIYRDAEPSIGRLLLDAGARVDLRDSGSKKWSVLHHVARSFLFDEALLHLLVGRGANINATCEATGDTPLILAAKTSTHPNPPPNSDRSAMLGHTAQVAAFLAAGADPRILNKAGETALKVVKQRQQPKADDTAIVLLLEKALNMREVQKGKKERRGGRKGR